MIKSLKYRIPLFIFFIGSSLFLIHELIDARHQYAALHTRMQEEASIVGNRMVSHIELRQLHNIELKRAELIRQISYYSMLTLNKFEIYDENGHSIFISISAISEPEKQPAQLHQIFQNLKKNDAPHFELLEGSHKILAYYPIKMPALPNEIRGKKSGILFMEFDFSEEAQIARNEIILAAFINFSIIFSLVLFLSYLLYRTVLQRIEWLNNAAMRIKNDDYTAIEYNGIKDEIGEAIISFNSMRATIQHQITENKKIYASLKEGQRIAKFGIWEWDMLKNTLWWSDGIYLLFGLEPQEFEATYEGFLNYVHPDDRELVIMAVTMAVETKQPYFVRHRILRAYGDEECIVEEQGEIVYDENDKPVFMKGTIKDVTELIRTQRELEAYQNSLELQVEAEIAKRRQQEDMLIQQSRLAAMGEMVGNIAHQWRQPLNTLSLVIGNLEDAYERGDLTDEAIHTSADKAYALIDNMSATIDDFRNFFSPDKSEQVFSLKDVIEETIGLLEASLKYSHIDIRLHHLGDAEIRGYKNELSQVLLNIINNAKDALFEQKNEHSFIEITEEITESSLFIHIKDNAGGIPKEIINRIFDPYFTTKEQGKGTGIGLYMSKTIIEEHMNGSLTVCNDDEGAVFTLRLPKFSGADNANS